MQGAEILHILKCDSKFKDVALHIVCMTEKWPDPLNLSAYVINSAKCDEEGEHWSCFWINKDWSVDYMDSYGCAPTEVVYKWLTSKRLHPIRYNDQWLQSFKSHACGFYCIYFLYKKVRNCSLENILNVFSLSNLRYNDNLVTSFYLNLSGRYS